MQVEIFDVGHGACAVITAQNGRRMMIDCGTNPERSWWPSIHYMGQSIDVLAISNFDEDHVADFSAMHSNCTVPRYQLNNSITAGALSQMKAEGGMRQGIQAVHEVLTTTGVGPGVDPLDFSPVYYRPYYNCYGTDFSDTNNLSLVLIFEYAGFKMIFPGDLERAGWRKLLEDSQFAQDLVGVDIFVASHHGRDSGCCEEVFEIWKPQITVISDKDKEFDSQETVPWYQQRSRGIPHENQTKYVYTTRKNGHMRISVDTNGSWTINVGK
jgi:beta-lactamase superfamily II metal-dependent hydrolase